MVNAFWLDHDPQKAVEWLVDSHVTAGVFECSMVLTTAAQKNGYPEDKDLYYSHENHPLTEWAAESYQNWWYLYRYAENAHQEWRYRWNHMQDETHKSWGVVGSLDLDRLESLDWASSERSDPPQLTGEWEASGYVDAYRLYYANDKQHLYRWSGRERPPWLDEYRVTRTTD